ncbi:alanine racemase [Tianweitania sediminis]|uniref:Alanine racemase n=1 Tax=Tianweitania sediminis TaxID=1502156 RepID=A0A8J7RGI0_9HYPH|nr:alanine racemase [Tianweitania sediminis]MBP0438011.1 alanine racemase [Tianweitania sediminis]
MTSSALKSGGILTVDLEAVAANWKLLSAKASPARCAAVVKADGYGLGAVPVAAALQAVGCKEFFVAHLQEGIALREATGWSSRVFVLNGTPPGTEGLFVGSDLIPVINTAGELARWRSYSADTNSRMPVGLQLDTGMSRLGMTQSDLADIAADPTLVRGLDVVLVMSHLACADDAGSCANESQRKEFARLRAMLPCAAPGSLANSSGIFLGEAYGYDLVRPGAALYGINPDPSKPNPMRQAVNLSAPVIQARRVPEGSFVGYGYAARVRRSSALLTVSLGYADGWPRTASSLSAFFGGQRLPLVGRVSMDTLVVDATDCAHPPVEGDLLEFICPQQTLDDIASSAGTIGYEILTGLGNRFRRIYLAAPRRA